MAFHKRLKLMVLLVCFVIIVTSLLLTTYFNVDTKPREAFEKRRNTFTLTSPNQTLQMIGNFTDFRFVINTDVCDDDDVYVLVVIGSHPGHYQLRNVLRQTIGRPGIEGLVFRTVFTFGYLQNHDQQVLLEKESAEFGDIIQGNFLDSYRNMTLRDLMGFRWAWQHCPQARFVVRMDDDTSVDIYRLVKVMEAHSTQLTTSVGCFYVWVNGQVLRDGGYGLSKEEHPNDVYEPYCQGWMYVLTPQMAFNLDVASVKLRQYWMNDAYITGTVVSAIGAKPIDLHINFTVNLEEIMKSMESWPPRYIVGPTGANPNLTFTFHQNYRKLAIENHVNISLT